MILTTLVTGDRAEHREAAIAASIDLLTPTAVILEGLPSGRTPLDEYNAADPNAGPHGISHRHPVHIARIAPGCLCCTGNITMRVTLNRIIRKHPERLYISLATNTHLESIHAFLTAEPYDKLLSLTGNMHAGQLAAN